VGLREEKDEESRGRLRGFFFKGAKGKRLTPPNSRPSRFRLATFLQTDRIPYGIIQDSAERRRKRDQEPNKLDPGLFQNDSSERRVLHGRGQCGKE